jgi:Fe-S cluster biosynthesis and repair protein YggX
MTSPNPPTAASASRLVHCIRYGAGQPGLLKAPYPGELGERVLAEVSQRAWQDWLKHQTRLINEQRLVPVEPKTRAYLREQMERFFFLGGVDQAAGYVPPSAGSP